MKIEQPSKTVEVCDICRRGGFLQTCLVCGGRYCLTCDAIIAGCWVKPAVCRTCSKSQKVEDIVLKYAGRITPVIKLRDAALKRLNGKGASEQLSAGNGKAGADA